jgi:CubicO group peptidase (beta-lactamase class C family)
MMKIDVLRCLSFLCAFARGLALTMIGCIALSAQAAAADRTYQSALRQLEQRARETGSDAVVVYLHGVKILDYHSASSIRPIYTMSCTKSIVALAIGEAIAEGKIKNIDEPVYDFFPEWNQGRKKLITIRQLLSMTTGLQHNGMGSEVYAAPDSVKLALAAELQTVPGAAFSYNNKSVNLLAGIIHVATGEWLDVYVDSHFFDPMKIRFWKWDRDDAGDAYAMADLQLLADDFAKFGLLITQRGQWDGKQLVPAAWIDELGLQSQPYEPLYGLLWWRVPSGATGVVTAQHLADLKRGGADPKLIQELTPLVGKPVHSTLEWHRMLSAAVPDWLDRTTVPGLMEPYGSDIPTWHYDAFDGIAAEGYLGQYLVVFPKLGLVAVRQIEPFDKFDFLHNRFEDFPAMVRKLVPSGAQGSNF